MARRIRKRSIRGGGTIDQMPSGRWRLRVAIAGKKITYGIYSTEEAAITAQGRWRTTHLLPADDPEPPVDVPASLTSSGLTCEEWFERWQAAKKGRRSRVRVNKKRGGAISTASRDLSAWRPWWRPAIGYMPPTSVTQAHIVSVINAEEAAGLAPNTIKTHWSIIHAFFQWMVEEQVLSANPMAGASVAVDPVRDRRRDVVVPDFRFIDLLSERPTIGWSSSCSWERVVVGPRWRV